MIRHIWIKINLKLREECAKGCYSVSLPSDYERALYCCQMRVTTSLSSVQFLSRVRLFVTPWAAARQASLSITSSQSLPKLISTESVMPSNHLILCHPLLPLPSIFSRSGSFLMSQLFASGGQSIGVSASASVLPLNTQD